MKVTLLLVFAFLTAGLAVPAAGQFAEFLRLSPVIHAVDQDHYEAMKSAPLIVVAEILSTQLISDARYVDKPLGVGGPSSPTIPLHLARISARGLLTLRGEEQHLFEFYSWIWASGKHGGPRLFRPYPGSVHILFLREDYTYLHTVGDYPNSDLEIPSAWLATFISEWTSSLEEESDPFDRIVDVRLRSELQDIPDIQENYRPRDMLDLIELTSPFFVAHKLDSYCQSFASRFGRFAACAATGAEFDGRCQAYRFAGEADPERSEGSFLAERWESCIGREAARIDDLRERNWPDPFQFQRRGYSTDERRRLTMRYYASALDNEFHKSACEAAATMPEARDIPECPALTTQ